MQKGKILSNLPCNSDLFEGEVHRKLAITIADEIEQDPNCSIIGIDGGWGSGKSNLVGMIQKELSTGANAGKYHFFTYDAWGHQTDLQRRTILEELTSDLVKGHTPILNENSWKESLENLLAKKKQTNTKTIPAIGIGSIVSLFSILFTPFITHLASLVSIDWLKPVILAIPYLVAYGFFGYRHYGRMKDKYEQDFTWEKCLSEFFLIYKDKIKEETKYETISEKEPSSRQFKEWIHGIDESLKRNNNIVLVLVIDNMDRLPKQKVQELWAAIHSCFSEEKYTNIRIIVPFDRLHIRNAFQSEDIPTKGGEDPVPKAVYGNDFINKTFYIVYHVAPPILSGWKQYFAHQWEAAFGSEYSVDNSVLQVYDMLTKEHTPRKIVAFINEFVTLKSIVDSKIPDKYIALFIFGRSTISEDPMTQILSPTYLGALNFMYKDDKEMPGYISSLYYQLPIEDAIDVVYTRQFTRELDDNALSSISLMKNSGTHKFFAILDHAIASVTNTNNATNALEQVLDNETTSEIQNCWECLYLKDRSVRGEIKAYLPYQKVLLSHIQNKSQYIKDLIRGYHKNFTKESAISDYVSGIDELACVKEIDIYALLSKLKKEISPKQFVELVDIKTVNYKQYGLYCSDDKLSNYLDEQDISEWDKLRILPSLTKNGYQLESFKLKIEENLRKGNLDLHNTKVLFSRLKELKNDNEPITYRNYFDPSKLESLYTNCGNDDFKYDLLAMRLSELSNNNRSFFNQIFNNIEEDDIANIAKVSYNYIDYGTLLCALDTFNNPCTKALCKYLTINKEDISNMDILKVATKFPDIIEYSDITASELLIRMNDWVACKEQITLEKVPSLPIILFSTAKDNDCELSSYILDLADKYLLNLSQEEWSNYLLNKESFPIKLLQLHHVGKIQPFFDAFKATLKDYAKGASNINLSKDTLQKMIQISNNLQHDVKKLFRELRDIFFTFPISKEKLILLGEWLFEYGNLSQKSGCLDKIFPSEILDDTSILQLMNSHKYIVKAIVENTSDSTEFMAKLKAMALSNRADDETLKELCKYLNIRLKAKGAK